MNKLLIVGHSSTPSADIERILNECGMAAPLPSRKERLSPRDVGRTIRKASVGSFGKSGCNPALTQLKPGPVWQGLVLDLMLGNVEQDFWGWSDSEAVELLDYWKELDPAINFVLVYSDPKSILGNASSLPAGESKDWIEKNLAEWCAYNSAILEFHNFNRDRSVLVHGAEALSSVHAYLQQLRIRLDAPLNEPPQSLLSPPDGKVLEAGAGEDPACRPELSIACNSAISKNMSSTGEGEGGECGGVVEYLGQQLLLQYPDVLRLYEELQSVANLPSAREIDSSLALRTAWAESQENERQTAQLRSQIKLLRHEQIVLGTKCLALEEENLKFSSESEKLRAALTRTENQEAALRSKNALLLAETTDLQKEGAELKANWKQLEGENELLLNQLHIVQEELERYHQEFAVLKRELTNSKSPQLFGAADRVKGQLEYRLGAVMIQRSRSFGGWVGMLGALRSTVRIERRECALKDGDHLPPISSYRDAHEAERVKRHLSYRLGTAYLANSHSLLGWVRMPSALRRQIREFKIDRASRN